MVLLTVDTTGIRNAACLMALLIIPASAFYSESDLAVKDMECDRLKSREHNLEAYEKCSEDLKIMVEAYVSLKAKEAKVSNKVWLEKNCERYDQKIHSYVLAVTGGTNHSKRFVYVDALNEALFIKQEFTDDVINEKFNQLKMRQSS